MPDDIAREEQEVEGEVVVEEVEETPTDLEVENEFEGLLDDDGEEVLEDKTPEPEPEEETATPVEDDATSEEEKGAIPKEEEETAEEPVVETPEPEPKPTKTYAETRAEVADTLEKQYQFDDETVELLRTEPEKVLPKLAADLMLDMHENMGRYLAKQLPRMVESINQNSSTRAAAVDDFFKDYGELRKPEYKELLDTISTTHRQMNPTMPADQFKREIAAMAMIQLKIPFDPETGLPITKAEEVPPPIRRVPAGSQAAPVAPRDVQTEWDEMLDED